jgi:hypothetical protein
MKKNEALELLGNRPRWELLNMKKALESLGGFFNTEEDDKRLEAVNILLK